MMQPFLLKRTIGNENNMDLEDTLNAKKALQNLGHYTVPDFGLTPYPDKPMINGIKSFQRQHGLKVDGIMKPKGPTIERINQNLTSFERRNSSSDSPDQRNDRNVATLVLPPIIYKIAEFFGIAVMAAWTWWQSMSALEQRKIHHKVGGKKSNGQEKEDCENLYYKVDIPTCNAISRRRGKRAAARCFASANERYAACRRGVPVNQLPPLDTWTN
jgi:peptidoglycan hydrolase-like protein with peptidoglycan-binding domain